MRCCKHYSPNITDTEQHEGLGIAEHYEFDRLLPHPSCVNPEVTGGQPFTGCPFSRNQDKCNYYEAERTTILRTAQHENITLNLEMGRVNFGIMEFYITSQTEGEEKTILHTINAHEIHEDPRGKANKLFEEAMHNTGGEDIERPAVNPTEHSYILEVTNGVLAHT